MSALTNTFGYLMICFYLAITLYGFELTLCLRYFHLCSEDKWYTKLLVGFLFLLATLHSATFAWFIYESLISRFGDVYKLNELAPSGAANLYIIFTMIFTAQWYFISRIWKLSEKRKRIWMVLPTISLTLATACFGLYSIHLFETKGRYTAIFSLTKNVQIVDTLAILCDSTVTLQLCYLLHKNKRRTRMKSTSSLINRILLNLINRGGLNLIHCFAVLFMLHKSPRTTLFTIPFGTAGHVMIISVYVTLLSRKTIRKKYDKQFHGISDFQITAAAEHSVAGTESSLEDRRYNSHHGAAFKAAIVIEAESPNQSPCMPRFNNDTKGVYAE